MRQKNFIVILLLSIGLSFFMKIGDSSLAGKPYSKEYSAVLIDNLKDAYPDGETVFEDTNDEDNDYGDSQDDISLGK